MKKIVAEEGSAGLVKGWVPTLFGYGAQGMFKFGLNEFFKDLYSGIIGEDALKSKGNKMAMWAAASGSAEVFADIALCPFEMTKVKMQVHLPGDAAPLPKGMLAAMGEMSKNKAETKFPFGSLKPLWGRQGAYCGCRLSCWRRTWRGMRPASRIARFRVGSSVWLCFFTRLSCRIGACVKRCGICLRPYFCVV